tara:strand:- start:966 stop:1439 length:474 start_codon:yes stop_codon:yes gene_type:complete
MIKKIIRAIYLALISIVLISIILAGWTCFVFISQPTKSDEIINFVHDIYKSQKSVIIDAVDLSKLLIKDKSEKIASEDNNLLTESELLTDQEDKSLLDEASMLEDKGENPLGIVIEPSLPEVREEILPELSDGSFENERSEVSMNKMEKGIYMNQVS